MLPAGVVGSSILVWVTESCASPMNSIAKPELVAEATIAPQNESWDRLFASLMTVVVGDKWELNALMVPDEPLPEDTAMNEVVLSLRLVGLRVVWLV